ncbi:hypothetical protein SBF1_5620010 [Candidatus Desulfosporosinus infrequens]|uniref:Uncharacterized protein n=1 Tax=Candidatus Desulfosporosinus infrequens TaxID=2043169 RepID=A0A2U3LK63_9FIRM|nr:hypothetical protein SBF1_5620010 [Candidatus Desulfosporosinus infrequens]
MYLMNRRCMNYQRRFYLNALVFVFYWIIFVILEGNQMKMLKA